MGKKTLCVVLSLLLLIGLVPAALAEEAPKADAAAIHQLVGGSVLANAKKEAPGFGTGYGEWTMLGLARSYLLEDAEGQAVIDAYLKNCENTVTFKSGDQIHRAKSTENSRLIMGLTAVGRSATEFNCAADGQVHNLVNGLTDMKFLKKQGNNGPIWALIAFDTLGFDIPENPAAGDNQVTRAKLIRYILDAEAEEGGWGLFGNSGDPDMTGMAMQALAPYYDKHVEGIADGAVKAAVDRAIAYLSAIQLPTGGFASWGTENNVESTSQAVVGLCALGVNPHTDERFIKNGISLIDAICSFHVEDPKMGHGFRHTPDGNWDGMATDQAFYGLTAYIRFVNGDTSLYDMTDVGSEKAVAEQIAAIGEVTLEKEEAVKAARAAFDKLSPARQKLVANAADLTAAETLLAVLKLPKVDAKAVYDKALAKLQATADAADAFGFGYEWTLLGLVRSHQAVPAGYYESVVKHLNDGAAGKLEKEDQPTDYAKMILALTALGKDPTKVGSHNLIAKLADLDTTKNQGANALVMALIALDAGKYEPAADATADRAALVNAILAARTQDGGWTFWGDAADPDMTGMGIQALAPYYDADVEGVEDGAVKAAVDGALELLSAMQLPNGGFASWGSEAPESAAQVLTALAAMGIDPDTDARFVKNGRTVVDALCGFAEAEGGFHAGFAPGFNLFSTEQATYALTAYERMKNGETFLYDMRDVAVMAKIDAIGQVTLDSKAAIGEARAAYEALGAKVANEQVLIDAEMALAGLEEAKAADEAAAKAVADKIAALGEVTLDSKAAIEAVRAAYDSLTAEQKALVTNLSALTAAEAELERLEEAPATGQKPIWPVVTVAGVALVLIVLLVVLSKKKK